jgi:hypothetical protein
MAEVVDSPPAVGGERRYELKIVAAGVVRDADGNAVSQEPLVATAILTESEVLAQLGSKYR